MAKSNGITKYMEKYFDTKFGHLHEEIKLVRDDVKVIKLDLKKNGKCLHKIEKIMVVYRFRVKWISIALVAVIAVLILGVLGGVELITKGVLGFIR